jgi:hypothetical protein
LTLQRFDSFICVSHPQRLSDALCVSTTLLSLDVLGNTSPFHAPRFSHPSRSRSPFSPFSLASISPHAFRAFSHCQPPRFRPPPRRLSQNQQKPHASHFTPPLSDADVSGCCFAGAIVAGATLPASLAGCDLRDVDFSAHDFTPHVKRRPFPLPDFVRFAKPLCTPLCCTQV